MNDFVLKEVMYGAFELCLSWLFSVLTCKNSFLN